MVKVKPRQAIFLFPIMTIMLFTSGCGSTTATIGASYQPPFAPVSFAIDTSGTISIQGNASIVTPVGTFALEANVSNTLQPEDNTLLVIIRHKQDGRVVDDVYKIQTSQDEVKVTTNGTTTVDVTLHKVFIDASKGSIKSIEVQGATPQSTPANTQVAQSSTARVYQTSLGAVYSVAWSPNGKYIAVAGASSGDQSSPTAIEVRDAFSGKIVSTYKGHIYLVEALAWSSNGKYIASEGYDYTVQVWEAFTGREIAIYKPGDWINTLAWSPNGKYLAFGGAFTPDAQIWDVFNGEQVSTYTGHAGSVESLSWSPDGHYIVSSGDEHTVQIWNAFTGEHLFTYNGSGGAHVVAWSPDGKRIASLNEGKNSVQIWKPFTGDLFLNYTSGLVIQAICWSPNGKYIASTSDDWSVRVWNTSTGADVLTYSGHTNEVRTVAWSPDGKYIASGGDDGTVQIWDAPSS